MALSHHQHISDQDQLQLLRCNRINITPYNAERVLTNNSQETAIKLRFIKEV